MNYNLINMQVSNSPNIMCPILLESGLCIRKRDAQVPSISYPPVLDTRESHLQKTTSVPWLHFGDPLVLIGCYVLPKSYLLREVFGYEVDFAFNCNGMCSPKAPQFETVNITRNCMRRRL